MLSFKPSEMLADIIYSNSIKVDRKKVKDYSFPAITLPAVVTPSTMITNTGYSWRVSIEESLGLRNTLEINGGQQVFQLAYYSIKKDSSPLHFLKHEIQVNDLIDMFYRHVYPDYDGQIQFVHYNRKYKNIKEASKNSDGLAVLIVYLKIGKETNYFREKSYISDKIDNEGELKELKKIMETLSVIEKPGMSALTNSPVDHEKLFPSVSSIRVDISPETNYAQIDITKSLSVDQQVVNALNSLGKAPSFSQRLLNESGSAATQSSEPEFDLLLRGPSTYRREPGHATHSRPNQRNRKVLIEAGVLQPLINILTKGKLKDQKEADWAVTNLTSGGSEQQIVQLCQLLAAKDDKTVSVVLDGVSNILSTAKKHGEADKVALMIEECGGLDRIKNLQTRENEAIYQKTLQIIESFFPDEGAEDDGVAPKAAEDGLEFSEPQ